uniref:Zinc metalloproteinase n=1 Tax=Strongyloides papillosus TaxID=174720 RepID=A0A0N5BCV3_STREA
MNGELIENTTDGNDEKNGTTNDINKKLKLFQGDMVLNPNQAEDLLDKVVEKVESTGIQISEIIGERRRRKKRKMDANMKLTWKFPILYFVEREVNGSLIDIALKLMELETCIRFQRVYNIVSLEAGLRFFAGDGCYSSVGRRFTYSFQDVSIGEGCDTIGTVQHETMHALGSYHEQSRSDRDNYLKVFLENVEKENEYNFLKVQLSSALTYDTKYDYGSDMQYSTTAFSRNEKPTMLPVEPLYAKTLGVNSGLSFVDAKLLNSYYCMEKCRRPISCANGYQNPNDCERCKCVDGYVGNRCDKLPPNTKECGVSNLLVLNEKKLLFVVGKKDCIYHIRTRPGKKLKMTVRILIYFPGYKTHCKLENSLEIKYLIDKTVTGALLCLFDNSTTIISKGEHVIVHHRSTKVNNGVKLEIESI